MSWLTADRRSLKASPVEHFPNLPDKSVAPIRAFRLEPIFPDNSLSAAFWMVGRLVGSKDGNRHVTVCDAKPKKIKKSIDIIRAELYDYCLTRIVSYLSCLVCAWDIGQQGCWRRALP